MATVDAPAIPSDGAGGHSGIVGRSPWTAPDAPSGLKARPGGRVAGEGARPTQYNRAMHERDDTNGAGQGFVFLMPETAKPVDWAYEARDEVVETLRHKDNRQRAIAAQTSML